MKKLLLIALLIVGCEEDGNPELDNFSGITEIDSDGNIISEDSDDWYGSEYRNTHCVTDTESESDISEGEIGIKVIPATYSFLPAFPNPFDSLVSIHYGLPTDSDVKIRIIDRNGNQIRMLVNDNQGAGSYCVSWDGKDDNGDIIDSELYRLLFHAEDFFSHGDVHYIPQLPNP